MNNNLLSHYTNRELSWLKFNERVLEEAECEGTPLMERLMFVSIFNSNLDEFFMIRVGSLYDQSLLKKQKIDNKTGLNASEQLALIYPAVKQLLKRRDKIYTKINTLLSEYNCTHLHTTDINTSPYGKANLIFKSQIMHLLSPQIIKPKHPFPHLENKTLYVALWLKHKTKNKHSLGLIPINANLPRIIKISDNETFEYALVEQLLLQFASDIFPSFIVEDKTILRVIRNADINVNEGLFDDEFDYREIMLDLIEKRNKLAPVRLDLTSEICEDFKHFLLKKLDLKSENIFINHSPLNLNYISQLKQVFSKEQLAKLYNAPRNPSPNTQIDPSQSIITQVLNRDILINVPFESIDPIITLLNEAANNKNVLSIKTTLYRLSANSKVIQALETAAKNGITVTALLELKARFDEANNIEWSELLEQSGCNVLYGVDEYKVHSKIILITMQIDSKIKQICYVGTGNFNETTAKLYTDLGILTADEDICKDATKFFENISTTRIDAQYENLLIAPTSYKNKLMACIDNEINYHQKFGDGHIICKFNSLTDKEMIDKFYQASQAGVKVDLIIRGICCLKTGIPNLSQNIRVISIVGRYLEHSRIFYFKHGNTDSCAIFIGSGDLMTRNTERRVEIAIPVNDSYIKNRLIQILDIIVHDNIKARELKPDDTYEFVHISPDDKQINSQELLFNI